MLGVDMMQYKNTAEGQKCGKMIKTVCLFGIETHAQIKEMAGLEGCSFAQKVRELVELGMMEMEDRGE